MAYEVRIRRSAFRYLNKLDAVTAHRLAAAIDGLTAVPPKGDIRPLAGQPGVYRLRVGNYRVLFHVDHQHAILFIDAIGPRGDIYK
jgi:mRNA interferase RelE/StbE